MTPGARLKLFALLGLAIAGPGCGEVGNMTTDVQQTPGTVLSPKAPDEAAKEKAEAKEKAAVAPEAPAIKVADAPAVEKKAAVDDQVDLIPVKFDELIAQIAQKKARLTMVDAWATWCGPCKENFPHVVAMNQKYAEKGLAVVSLSLDDPTKPKDRAAALDFLREKAATFSNFLLDEEQEAAFEHLKINAIPAVFLYGSDGKELKRFTLDDPNNQFTYDEVEKAVAEILKGDAPAP